MKESDATGQQEQTVILLADYYLRPHLWSLFRIRYLWF